MKYVLMIQFVSELASTAGSQWDNAGCGKHHNQLLNPGKMHGGKLWF